MSKKDKPQQPTLPTVAGASAPVQVPTPAVPVEVLTKDENMHAKEIQKLADAIIIAAGEMGTKYLNLITYIRTNQVAPKLVSFELRQKGFTKQRVNELNRIANASDEVYNQYQSKLLSFRDALELARVEKAGETPRMTPATKLLVDEGVLDSEDVDKAIGAETADAAGKEKNQSSTADRRKAAAKFLAKTATRNQTFKFADMNYQVTVKKVSKVLPPSMEGGKA